MSEINEVAYLSIRSLCLLEQNQSRRNHLSLKRIRERFENDLK